MAGEARMAAAVLERPVILGASGLVGGSFYRELEGRGRTVRGTYLSRATAGTFPRDETFPEHPREGSV